MAAGGRPGRFSLFCPIKKFRVKKERIDVKNSHTVLRAVKVLSIIGEEMDLMMKYYGRVVAINQDDIDSIMRKYWKNLNRLSDEEGNNYSDV